MKSLRTFFWGTTRAELMEEGTASRKTGRGEDLEETGMALELVPSSTVPVMARAT